MRTYAYTVVILSILLICLTGSLLAWAAAVIQLTLLREYT